MKRRIRQKCPKVTPVAKSGIIAREPSRSCEWKAGTMNTFKSEGIAVDAY